VLWVAALLASLLSLPRLFAADFADGTLERIALS
jgi:heme exporter protein B